MNKNIFCFFSKNHIAIPGYNFHFSSIYAEVLLALPIAREYVKKNLTYQNKTESLCLTNIFIYLTSKHIKYSLYRKFNYSSRDK